MSSCLHAVPVLITFFTLISQLEHIRADQPPGTQRGNRGRARRRAWPGVRGSGRGSTLTRRQDPGFGRADRGHDRPPAGGRQGCRVRDGHESRACAALGGKGQRGRKLARADHPVCIHHQRHEHSDCHSGGRTIGVAEKINRNITNIHHTANQSATASHQTAIASQELASLAENLRGIVLRFRL